MSTQIKSYIIYNPVYRRIKKYIKRHGYRKYIVNTWNVCLDKFSNVFDMRLIWVNADDENLIKFLDNLTVESNCFYFWDKSPVISVDQQDFDHLKEFIAMNQLWPYIDKIQTQTRLSLVQVTVKVITFHPKILSNNILATFQRPPNFVEHQKSLYFAKAYEWLMPTGLNHFKTKIRYRYTHVVIYLLLDYYRKLRRRRNIRVLNLFDLCALRLAMFDPRYYQFDQCELPGLIHTEIRDIIEVRKRINPEYEFSESEYLIEQGIQSVPSTVAELFIIYASDYCSFVSHMQLMSTHYSYLIPVDEYVQLYTAELYEDFIIDFILKRPYLQIAVFSNRQALSLYLFQNIMHFPNVFSINLSTNFPVLELGPIVSTTIDTKIENKISVYFTGDSDINYLATYISWIKDLSKSRPINLHIRCSVADYSIFVGLAVVEVTFESLEINMKMISELCKPELATTCYVWKNATLEKHRLLLKMLHEGLQAQKLDIVLDENTFELIFTFIEQLFRAHSLTELEFANDLIKFDITILMDWTSQKLVLSEYVFKLNSEQFKIDMHDKRSQQVVDLYNILFEIEDSDEAKENYDFYQ